MRVCRPTAYPVPRRGAGAAAAGQAVPVSRQAPVSLCGFTLSTFVSLRLGVVAFGTLSRAVLFLCCIGIKSRGSVKLPLNMLWLYFCLCYLEWMLFARVVLGTRSGATTKRLSSLLSALSLDHTLNL